jgi:hypothetical protein
MREAVIVCGISKKAASKAKSVKTAPWRLSPLALNSCWLWERYLTVLQETICQATGKSADSSVLDPLSTKVKDLPIQHWPWMTRYGLGKTNTFLGTAYDR